MLFLNESCTEFLGDSANAFWCNNQVAIGYMININSFLFVDNCVFGDSPYNVLFLNESCSEFLGDSRNAFWCYNQVARDVCCETCGRHKRDNAHIPGENESSRS